MYRNLESLIQWIPKWLFTQIPSLLTICSLALHIYIFSLNLLKIPCPWIFPFESPKNSTFSYLSTKSSSPPSTFPLIQKYLMRGPRLLLSPLYQSCSSWLVLIRLTSWRHPTSRLQNSLCFVVSLWRLTRFAIPFVSVNWNLCLKARLEWEDTLLVTLCASYYITAGAV